MAKVPNTKKHVVQLRGREDSETYNQNSEDVYQDLVYLFNKVNELNSDVDEGYSAITKDINSMGEEIVKLEANVRSLQSSVAPKTVYLTGPEMRDPGEIVGTAYNPKATNTLSYDPRFNTYTLPKNATSSISRLVYYDSDGNRAVPPSLEMVVTPTEPGFTEVRTSQPFEAVLDTPGKVWERNVSYATVPSTLPQLDLFFNLPADLTSTEYANVINLVPFPAFGVDVTYIGYTTEAYPDLSTSATWTPLNKNAIYNGNTAAVGYVPPGGWTGDAILNAGPLSFVFPSERITAMRITLRQPFPCQNTPKFLYSYGLSYLDVRYEKFEATGKALFKITGGPFNTVTSVTPYIYNVTQAGLPDVYSSKVWWHQGNGVYSNTAGSDRNNIFLEVTLKKDENGNLPVLSGFKVVYT